MLKKFENHLLLAVKYDTAILVLLDAEDGCLREEAICLTEQAHVLNL